MVDSLLSTVNKILYFTILYAQLILGIIRLKVNLCLYIYGKTASKRKN